MLQPAPHAVTTDGDPVFGTYAGRCGETRLHLGERGVSRMRRFISEKRWQWFAAFDTDIAVGGAIVDAGFFGMAFLWVFDRDAGELVVDDDVLVPPGLLQITTHPTIGTLAAISLPGYRLRMGRTHETLTIEGAFAGARLSLDLVVDDQTAITAVCPVPERTGGINVTQKETDAPVSGRITVDTPERQTQVDSSAGGETEEKPHKEYTLDGVGFLDYSHGLLGRETRWDWAFGSCRASDGTPVAFNLVDQFNEGLENVVWVDGEPEAVGGASVEMDGPEWSVTTDCGTVDASLSVEGSRSKEVDVGLVESRYHQPLGRWSGTIAGYDVEGVGVAEAHLTRW